MWEIMNNIILIGFMGTGKTAISKYLEEKFNMSAIDTDHLISTMEGISIAKIFENKGEAYFRKLETKALKELSTQSGLSSTVISCGGGMALNPVNVKEMRKMGLVVLLKADPETIYSRVKDDNNRPLLKDSLNIEFIEDMLKGRMPYYERAADITIATDNKTLEEIVNEIVENEKTDRR